MQLLRSKSRVNREGFVELPEEVRERGMQAAAHHKTSVDRLLHPRRDGATPYRIVLGEVCNDLWVGVICGCVCIVGGCVLCNAKSVYNSRKTCI